MPWSINKYQKVNMLTLRMFPLKKVDKLFPLVNASIFYFRAYKLYFTKQDLEFLKTNRLV